MKLVMGKDGAWREYKKPYITIACETEEDFEYIKTAMDFYQNRKLVPQKWIPVTERLPEDADIDVLVVVSGSYKNITFKDAIEIAGYFEGVWEIEGHPGFESPNVTHWMPLPEPPEMDGGE